MIIVSSLPLLMSLRNKWQQSSLLRVYNSNFRVRADWQKFRTWPTAFFGRKWKDDLERVQKSALRVILKDKYEDYKSALGKGSKKKKKKWYLSLRGGGGGVSEGQLSLSFFFPNALKIISRH